MLKSICLLNPSIVLLYSCFLLCSCTSHPKHKIAQIKRTPTTQIGNKVIFDRYEIPEGNIIYYFKPALSKTAPLILTIQGSGCNSIYEKAKDGQVYGSLNIEAAEQVQSNAAVLAVEKPNVSTFYKSNAPAMLNCSPEFKRNFSRDRWIKTLQTAMQDVISVHDLTPNRIIAAGHSEGAEVAAWMAAETPSITHVIFSAGGGATQLYEFIINANIDAKGNSDLGTKQIKSLFQQWQTMAANPTAIEPLFMGHTPLYWTSFKTTSPMENLKKSKAKVYIINGTNDRSSPVESADLLATELTVANREFEYDRISGADHTYTVRGQSQMSLVMKKAFYWSLH